MSRTTASRPTTYTSRVKAASASKSGSARKYTHTCEYHGTEGTCDGTAGSQAVTDDGETLWLCPKHYTRVQRTGKLDKTTKDWGPIAARAAEIVNSYDIKVTLRQVFYRLVAEGRVRNNRVDYGQLGRFTAEMRRNGTFPALFENGRSVKLYSTWDSPADALREAADCYRIDRTAGQEVSLFLGVEKNALGGLLLDWFGDTGIPVVPLGGYSSETLERSVRDRVDRDGRPAVFIYAGDFDPSGMDLGRCFTENTADCWDETVRVALTEDQAMALPVLPGKAGDSRARGFIAEFPRIHEQARRDGIVTARQPVQIELDAVDPLELRRLYRDAIGRWWDEDAYRAALDREEAERAELADLADDYGGSPAE